MKLSKILSLLLVFVMLAAMGAGLAESEPVVLTVFTDLYSIKCTNPENLYFWKYAEWRLAQEGYNVKFDVAGGNGEGLIFRHGEIIRKVPESALLDELKKELDLYAVL